MANPFLVLGGVAVGVITAGIGVLAVPGWVAAAQDSVAVNDLASIRGAQTALETTEGAFSGDIADLQSGTSGTAVKLGAKLNKLAASDEGWCATVESASGAYFASGSVNGVIGKGETPENAAISIGCGDLLGVVDKTVSLASWTLNCTSTTEVTLPLSGATGDALWSDGTKSEANGETTPVKTLQGGVDYSVSFTGDFDAVTSNPLTTAAKDCVRRMNSIAMAPGTLTGGSGAGRMQAETKLPRPLSMAGAFKGMSNITDVPSELPEGVTDLSQAFYNAKQFNGDISGWDVSRVTRMESMFSGATAFNGDISGWDTSSLQSMHNMFTHAKSFNQYLGDWDTSNVASMEGLFSYAAAFDQPIGSWDVSKVKSMANMFSSSGFNEPIADWDVSAVEDMSGLFAYNKVFDQELSNWDTRSVVQMRGVFEGATSFNQPLAGWATGSVEDMRGMFLGASAFDQPIGEWDTSKVVDMSSMFALASKFNQPVSTWNTARVTRMDEMFSGAEAFNQSLNGWDVGNVTSMEAMFAGALHFNGAIDRWHVDQVTEMSRMFDSARAFSQNLAGWNINSEATGYGFASESGLEATPDHIPSPFR